MIVTESYKHADGDVSPMIDSTLPGENILCYAKNLFTSIVNENDMLLFRINQDTNPFVFSSSYIKYCRNYPRGTTLVFTQTSLGNK